MPATKKPTVRIRCYRQGFGDCFLLTFEAGKSRPCRVLIDCGVLSNAAEHAATMRQIATNIIEQSGGNVAAKKKGTVDVLVVTHEHWDHLSGFQQARDLFDQFLVVKAVWLAWTERADDPLARTLRAEFAKKKKTTRKLHERLRLLQQSSPAFSRSNLNALTQLDTLLGFSGDELGAAGGRPDPQSAMKFVREEWAGVGERSFHEPGDVLELPRVAGVRTYVLGPPRDRELLRRESSKKHGSLYELFFGLTDEDSLLAALDALDPSIAEVRDVAEVGEPFALAHRKPVDLTAKDPTAQLAPELAAFLNTRYAASGDEWRRIDADWLQAGSALALRMDKGINNTSLVLAFELPDGRVLLFPGDAQLGNWESWHDEDLSFQSRKAGGQRITARDLLARTVFYKVAHHGSHNATAQDLGLELMTHSDLMAFIPVSHQMALENKWSRIPLPGLVRRLRERAKDRVWFAVEYNRYRKGLTNPEIDELAQLTKQARTALKKSVQATELWFDFTL